MLTSLLLAVVSAKMPPTDLSLATFDDVRAYVRPTPQELRFQSLDWHRTVFSGIQAAQKADRPLLMWMYFGDPQGQC